MQCVTIDDYPCWVVKDGHAYKTIIDDVNSVILKEDLSSPGVSPS